jgi:hypothetical protein
MMDKYLEYLPSIVMGIIIALMILYMLPELKA